MPLNDDLLDNIEEMLAELGPKWSIIGRTLNQDSERIRGIWRRSGREMPKQPTEIIETTELDNFSSVLFTDKKKAESVNWREFLVHAVDGEIINEKLEYQQQKATIEIDTDKPIAIVYTADWHLGDSSTDHAAWYGDIRKVMDNDRVYMIDLGDDYQNMRSFKNLASVLNQVLTPRQQAAMIKSLVDELTSKNKLLAKIGGNHDEEFDQRIFGQALQEYLFENTSAPIFPNRGVLHLKVGKQEYTNLLFHKSRFRSFIRPAHGAFREWQQSYPAEVVAGAHDHIPALEILWAWASSVPDGMCREIFLLKTGTYQDSEYGWRYWGTGAFPVMPVVIYYPDRHHKTPFMSLDDALQSL